MVVLGGIGIAIVAGLIGTAVGGWLGGSSKKQTVSPVQSADVITHPYAHYAPVTSKIYQPTVSHQLDYVYAPSIQIESPQAQAAVVTTKKEAAQTPTTTIAPTIDQGGVISQPSQEASASQTDMGSMILIIGLVAVGGYVLVSMTKKKKTRRKK